MDIATILLHVEELEGQAHQIWDNATSNLAYGRLTAEMRDGYIQQTYEATRLHAEAMTKLRAAQAQLRAAWTSPN